MGDVETARRTMRKPYYFCRYVPTDERAPLGKGFLAIGPEHMRLAYKGSMKLARPHVYRLKREGDALWLLDQEAAAIQAAMTEEGQPTLLSEADAIEGKAL